jgi:hypothetical protein
LGAKAIGVPARRSFLPVRARGVERIDKITWKTIIRQLRNNIQVQKGSVGEQCESKKKGNPSFAREEGPEKLGERKRIKETRE